MEIKANYWPNTPELREIKIYYNGKVELSCFCNKEQIENMVIKLKEALSELSKNYKCQHESDGTIYGSMNELAAGCKSYTNYDGNNPDGLDKCKKCGEFYK